MKDEGEIASHAYFFDAVLKIALKLEYVVRKSVKTFEGPIESSVLGYSVGLLVFI